MDQDQAITDEVAALLRARLGYLNLSKSELARRTDMNREVLRRYLAGERHLTLGALFIVTDALGLDPASVISEAHKIARGDAEAGGQAD